MKDLRARTLGHTTVSIGALGLGTWALGGPWTAQGSAHYPPGTHLGYGPQDDAESAKVLDAALAVGIRLIDTANLYGAGHAERLIGAAIRGRRDKAVIATRFGHSYDPCQTSLVGTDTSPAAIRSALEASLRNLSTDYIDIFQLQVEFHSLQDIDVVFEAVERFIEEGKVRYTSWSTNYPARLQAIANRWSVQSGQFDLNIFQDSPDMLEVCDAAGLTAVARLPLGMGFLSGKITPNTQLPHNDVRASNLKGLSISGGDPRAQRRFWLRFFGEKGAARPDWYDKLASVREVLTSNGRTLAQGALCWIYARSPKTIAIPGSRTVSQLEENLASLDFGPLTTEQMSEIESILDRASDPSELFLQPFRPTK